MNFSLFKQNNIRLCVAFREIKKVMFSQTTRKQSKPIQRKINKMIFLSPLANMLFLIYVLKFDKT